MADLKRSALRRIFDRQLVALCERAANVIEPRDVRDLNIVIVRNITECKGKRAEINPILRVDELQHQERTAVRRRTVPRQSLSRYRSHPKSGLEIEHAPVRRVVSNGLEEKTYTLDLPNSLTSSESPFRVCHPAWRGSCLTEVF